MSVRLTSEAVAVIRRSLELAQMDPADTGVRLRLAGGVVRPRFAPEPQPGDETVEEEGIRVFVDPRILEEHPWVEIAVSEEHDELIVRPASG